MNAESMNYSNPIFGKKNEKPGLILYIKGFHECLGIMMLWLRKDSKSEAVFSFICVMICRSKHQVW